MWPKIGHTLAVLRLISSCPRSDPRVKTGSGYDHKEKLDPNPTLKNKPDPELTWKNSPWTFFSKLNLNINVNINIILGNWWIDIVWIRIFNLIWLYTLCNPASSNCNTHCQRGSWSCRWSACHRYPAWSSCLGTVRQLEMTSAIWTESSLVKNWMLKDNFL